MPHIVFATNLDNYRDNEQNLGLFTCNRYISYEFYFFLRKSVLFRSFVIELLEKYLTYLAEFMAGFDIFLDLFISLILIIHLAENYKSKV